MNKTFASTHCVRSSKKWYSGKSDGFNWILSCGGNGQDSVWYAQYLAKRVCDFYRAPRGCSWGLRIFVCETPLAFKNFDTEYFDNATGWFNFFSMLVDIKSFATIVYNFIDVPDFLLFFVFFPFFYSNWKAPWCIFSLAEIQKLKLQFREKLIHGENRAIHHAVQHVWEE